LIAQEIWMDPILVAAVYAVVGVVVVPLVFAFFRTQYQFLDVVLASVAAAAASCIPTIGGPVSLVVMVAVLYWRMGQNIFPDIVVAVGAARLAMVPVLLALTTPH
jgi:hypothetical protein